VHDDRCCIFSFITKSYSNEAAAVLLSLTSTSIRLYSNPSVGSHVGKKGNSIFYGAGIFVGVFFKGSPVKNNVFVLLCSFR
jgi:hypothetical protein